MGIKTAPHPSYSPDLAPCDFWLFPKPRGCRYETIEEMKEAVTKVIDTLIQEDFHWAFQKLLEQVHCSWWRLLRRGLEFHVCTLNKSAYTKKSGIVCTSFVCSPVPIHIPVQIPSFSPTHILTHSYRHSRTYKHIHFFRKKRTFRSFSLTYATRQYQYSIIFETLLN